MADDTQPPGEPSARRILSTALDQEALELDISQTRSFPQLSTTTTNQSTPNLLRWWRAHVSLGVPHVACRDHLGMLGRTRSTVNRL